MEDLKYYKNLLKIDKYELDEMCMTQPHLYYDISERYCSALNEKDKLKEKLAWVSAKVDSDIRKDKKPKLTEPQIKQKILIDKRYKKANKEYLQASYESELWKHLKDSFAQRGYMLKYLCELTLGNYYSTDSIRTKGSRQHYKGGEDQD